MRYNFDQCVDRSSSNSMKLLETNLHFGSNDVIPLWVADMDFVTATPIVEAIQQRAAHGIFGYTNRPQEYFDAIADWQRRRNGWQPDIGRMSFAPGVVPGMKLYVELFTQPGDKIIIQPPVYHPFFDIVRNAGRELVQNPLKPVGGGYEMDLDDFEAKAKAGAKCLLLCNPHNPVGRSWTREELMRLGELCLRYGVRVVSDEIHSDLMLFGHKHTVFASLSQELSAITTTCIATSKTFNLAGLQAATLVFPNEEMTGQFVKRLREMDIARNNCFSIVATIAACNHGEEWLEQLLTYIEGNMRFITDYCGQYIPMLKPNLPECTYLCWIDARELKMSDEKLLDFMVNKAGVAMNMGVGFGREGSGFLRLNAACPRSVLKTALDQIKTAIDTNLQDAPVGSRSHQ